ncbi:hypothetical protein [Streptosporangium sp. NPDC004631]
MIIEAGGKAADAITVTILPAIVAAIADSFVRDRRNGGAAVAPRLLARLLRLPR